MAGQNGVNRESLIASNDEYRKLHQEHMDLETRLRTFSEKAVLSDAEQIEETRLKKLKLAGRDRMEQIARMS